MSCKTIQQASVFPYFRILYHCRRAKYENATECMDFGIRPPHPIVAVINNSIGFNSRFVDWYSNVTNNGHTKQARFVVNILQWSCDVTQVEGLWHWCRGGLSSMFNCIQSTVCAVVLMAFEMTGSCHGEATPFPCFFFKHPLIIFAHISFSSHTRAFIHLRISSFCSLYAVKPLCGDNFLNECQMISNNTWCPITIV